MNQPIDILAVASLLAYNAEQHVQACRTFLGSDTLGSTRIGRPFCALHLAFAQREIAEDDLLRVQSLILELATEG